MKQIIGQVLLEKLDKVTYQSDRASALTKEIADAIKFQLKGWFSHPSGGAASSHILPLPSQQLRSMQIRRPGRDWRAAGRRRAVRPDASSFN